MTRQHPTWRKSSRSEAGEACVEIAAGQDGTIGVRDSKAPASGQLSLSRRVLAGFLREIKAGRLDP